MVQVLCEDWRNHTLSLCHVLPQNPPKRKTFNIGERAQSSSGLSMTWESKIPGRQHRTCIHTSAFLSQFMLFNLPNFWTSISRHSKYFPYIHKKWIFPKTFTEWNQLNFNFPSGKLNVFLFPQGKRMVLEIPLLYLSRAQWKGSCMAEECAREPYILNVCFATCIVQPKCN